MAPDDDLLWRKSSVSNDQGSCIEIAHHDHVAIRDSKHVDPRLTFDRAAWHHLLSQFGHSPYSSGSAPVPSETCTQTIAGHATTMKMTGSPRRS
ncbi:MAG TPA: DUF397 domain-containing protein [Actinokineospora sp.]|nr:DUF397 domain-containing protein [Actinokineospora sp.]